MRECRFESELWTTATKKNCYDLLGSTGYADRHKCETMNNTHFVVHDKGGVFDVTVFHEDAADVAFACAFAQTKNADAPALMRSCLYGCDWLDLMWLKSWNGMLVRTHRQKCDLILIFWKGLVFFYIIDTLTFYWLWPKVKSLLIAFGTFYSTFDEHESHSNWMLMIDFASAKITTIFFLIRFYKIELFILIAYTWIHWVPAMAIRWFDVSVARTVCIMMRCRRAISSSWWSFAEKKANNRRENKKCVKQIWQNSFFFIRWQIFTLIGFGFVVILELAAMAAMAVYAVAFCASVVPYDLNHQSSPLLANF